MERQTSLIELRGVGPALAAKFAVLGLRTLGDLIDNYARRYEDYSTIARIAEIQPGPVTIRAVVKQAAGRYAKRGLHITGSSQSRV